MALWPGCRAATHGAGRAPPALPEARACSVLPERGVGASSQHANEHAGAGERSWPPRGVGSWRLRPRGKGSPGTHGSSPARLWPAPGAPGQPGPWAAVLCRERGLGGPAPHQCQVPTGPCALGSGFLTADSVLRCPFFGFHGDRPLSDLVLGIRLAVRRTEGGYPAQRGPLAAWLALPPPGPQTCPLPLAGHADPCLLPRGLSVGANGPCVCR